MNSDDPGTSSLVLRWKYTNPNGLSQWYGRVEYYGPYIIGQWFALEADSGKELWSRTFYRPNSICDVSNSIIVASETRSDGPWTTDFGIYGISAKTGELLWTSHANGIWGKLWRALDIVLLFTNDLRDSPKRVYENVVYTYRGRTLDIESGKPIQAKPLPPDLPNKWESPNFTLLTAEFLPFEGDKIRLERGSKPHEFSIFRDGRHPWQFSAKERSVDVQSHRLHGDKIFMVVAEPPPTKTARHKPDRGSPAQFKLGILHLNFGAFHLFPLEDASGQACGIEAIRDHRILINLDGKTLLEYEYK